MRKQTKSMIAGCCVAALIAVGIGAALWHPWDAGGQDVAEEEARMDASGEMGNDVSQVNVSDLYRIMSAVGASGDGALQDYYEFVHMEPEYGYARDAARPYDADARIVQLSTCTLDADAGVRFVVTGVLVDGGQ